MIVKKWVEHIPTVLSGSAAPFLENPYKALLSVFFRDGDSAPAKALQKLSPSRKAILI